FYRRMEFRIQHFGRQFPAPPLVHTYTSVDHLTVTESGTYESILCLLNHPALSNRCCQFPNELVYRETGFTFRSARVEVREPRVSEQARARYQQRQRGHESQSSASGFLWLLRL